MTEVGLTGGIGSGKSTVGELLTGMGASLVDADAIVRELQEPGQVVFLDMVKHFGEGVITPEGRLDRQAVADIVFQDEAQLKILNDIVHPRLREVMEASRRELLAAGKKVIVDFPLLTESKYTKFEGVVVVDCDIEAAVRRLVEHRGFSEQDARFRMSQQATREERLKIADFVIDNSGAMSELEPQVQACWDWICGL